MSSAEQWAAQPEAVHVEDVADFLAACPPPVHTSDFEAWRRRVEAELGHGALPGLVELLEIGSPAEQDAAMATARALGAEVWAVGVEPELEWQVTLPGGAPRSIRPRRHARPRQL
ncbi:MAG: hypothetical protein ACRDZ7_06670 [Acidimicrobiia bacterium]